MSVISTIAPFLPQAVRSCLRPYYDAWLTRNWTLVCPICEKKVPEFLPLPSFYWEQLAQHGTDLRIEDSEFCNYKGYTCPNCGAIDRDRLCTLFLDKQMGMAPSPDFSMLDIAPSAALSQFIRKRYPIRYRTSDLYMEGVDDRMDITRMDGYADASFDALICSHVLEHIPDDRAAMAELFRVLKPGGWGILIVPISLSMREIREDFTKTTEAERWKYFGQNDHVRVYNRAGFMERLNGAGFKTNAIGSSFFGEDAFLKHGIAPSSVLYLVEK